MNDTAWVKVVSNNSLVERAVAVGDGGMTGVGEAMGEKRLYWCAEWIF
nr:hypothetical protein [Providencia sp. MGF014]